MFRIFRICLSTNPTILNDWDSFRAVFSNLHIMTPILTVSGILIYSSFKLQAIDKGVKELRNEMKVSMANLDTKLTGYMALYSMGRIETSAEVENQ